MTEEDKPTRLTRALNPMPPDIRDLLENRRLSDAYHARPPYQRNDYLGWIGRAKRPETRTKRIMQMLDELDRGTVYMNMPYKARNARKTN